MKKYKIYFWLKGKVVREEEVLSYSFIGALIKAEAKYVFNLCKECDSVQVSLVNE